ncbi:LacI family DNA-binding transcriptional regulator [Exiguobacterium acetylicum]|uniref:LacI family DNA-binding transcriptional regulator n=1 Tax=Exiguobacterium acetylicum TaxID=41170 RepID=UPI003977BB19
MASIREVAKLAGVSIATVSRVLNADEKLSVSPETRDKVLQTAKKLNYSPRQKKSYNHRIATVGLVTTVNEMQEIDDPYFRAIRRGIEVEAERQKVSVNKVIRLSEKKADLEGLNHLGAILVLGTVAPEMLEVLYHKNPNIIVIDDSQADTRFDAVYSDFKSATIASLEHLYELGHRHIAFIGGHRVIMNQNGESFMSEEEDRYQTYVSWMKQKELSGHMHGLLGEWKTLEGLRLGEQLTEHKDVTAVLVASDPMAVGVYRAFQRSGYRIPEDISVSSFDDIEIAEFLTPSLTTVKVETEELGKFAIKMALERIRGERDMPIRLMIPAQLIKRESVSPKN